MNDIVTTNVGELAPFLNSGGTGFENIDSDCILRPYLAIAQNTSDMATKGSPNYLQGLEPGMFYSPTIRKVFGNEVDISIVKFYPTYNIFGGRDQKGKAENFVASIDRKTFLSKYAQDYKLIDGDYINQKTGEIAIDKRNFIIMFPNDISIGMFMLSLSSTGIPVARQLMTQALNIRVERNGKVETAPIWSSVWKLLSSHVQGKNGLWYYQITNISRVGWVSKQIAPVIKSAFDELKDEIVNDEIPIHEEQTHQQKVSTVERVFSSAPKPDIDIF